jgi:hypothetical protein
MGWSSPRLPEDVFSVLSECIEVFHDEPAEMMAQMIRLLQVQHLCLAQDVFCLHLDDSDHAISWRGIEHLVLQAAELWARGDNLPSCESTAISAVDRLQIYNALLFAGCFRTSQEINALADQWQWKRDHPIHLPPDATA